MIKTVSKTYDAFAIEGSSLKATIPVPASVEDFDQLGGKPGLCLASGIDNDWYRGGAADLRYFFCELFEKQITGEFRGHAELKRKLKVTGKRKRKDATGAEIEEDKVAFAEGEAEYVRRVLPILAELRTAEEVKVEEFQPIVDRLLAAYESSVEGESFTEDPDKAKKDENGEPIKLIRIDPTERERAERGPKTLPKTYAKAGEALVAQGQGDAFIAHYGVTFDIPEEVAADPIKVNAIKAEAIGWKIKSLEDAERAKQDLTAKYAVPSGAETPAPAPAPVPAGDVAAR